jgi:tetratricopeptide (TPR) repeat protein
LLPQTEVGDQPCIIKYETNQSLFRRFEEAKVQYQRVLEIEPRHPQALAFLGMIYHLLNATDKAIIKYHEVSP